jgi:hypothetical protein
MTIQTNPESAFRPGMMRLTWAQGGLDGLQCISHQFNNSQNIQHDVTGNLGTTVDVALMH